MSVNRGQRIDRRTTERVLGGDLAAGGPRVRTVLSAAAGPALPGELAGEQAVVAAFRTARAAHIDGRPTTTTVIITPRRARWMTARLAVAAAATATAAVTVSAVVTTATTSSIPVPATSRSTPTNPSSITTPDTASTPSRSGGTPTDDGHPGNQAGTQPAAPPDPSLTGLCHAYAADHGKAPNNPAFATLITTAGGRDKVDSYCTTLLTGKHHTEPQHPRNPIPHSPAVTPPPSIAVTATKRVAVLAHPPQPVTATRPEPHR